MYFQRESMRHFFRFPTFRKAIRHPPTITLTEGANCKYIKVTNTVWIVAIKHRECIKRIDRDLSHFYDGGILRTAMEQKSYKSLQPKGWKVSSMRCHRVGQRFENSLHLLKLYWRSIQRRPALASNPSWRFTFIRVFCPTFFPPTKIMKDTQHPFTVNGLITRWKINPMHETITSFRTSALQCTETCVLVDDPNNIQCIQCAYRIRLTNTRVCSAGEHAPDN